MPTAIVMTKGRITIPVEVRQALNIQTGDRLRFIADRDGVCRLIAAAGDVRRLKGLVGKPAKPVSVDEMNRVIIRRGPDT